MQRKGSYFVSICGLTTLLALYHSYFNPIVHVQECNSLDTTEVNRHTGKEIAVNWNNRSSCQPIQFIQQPLPSYNASSISKSRLIAFPIFSLMTSNNYNAKELGDRMLDFLESLWFLLMHPLVSQVHLLYEQDAMPYYIECRIGFHPKLKLIKVESTYIYSKVFQYIHVHYKNQMVMVINGDIYPGEGLEHLDYDLMKSKRLFYSLTRHGRQETRCKMPRGYCDVPIRYTGSHDVYIFIPTAPIPDKGLAQISHKWDDYGMENLLMVMYNRTLNYRVLNPCLVIFVYHNHCSDVHHKGRRFPYNINNKSKYMRSPPTRRLQ